MPIYIYRCSNCGVQFERHQSFTDEPLKRCPECSKNSLRKVYTPAGIVFKGSGWYATDHKSASGQVRSAKSESKEAAPASESKPESQAAKTDSSDKSGSSDSSSSASSKPESAGKTQE